MSRPRKLFNGDLIFPPKGRPPKPMDGYFIDEGNPYVLHKTMVKCDHLKPIIKRTKCGAQKITYMCERDDFITNYIGCEKCKGIRD